MSDLGYSWVEIESVLEIVSCYEVVEATWLEEAWKRFDKEQKEGNDMLEEENKLIADWSNKGKTLLHT